MVRKKSASRRIGHHLYVTHYTGAHNAEPMPGDEDSLKQFFNLLCAATGVDFSYYKRTTIMRRIERRMALRRIERPEDFINYLKEDQAELEALYQDILIKVTGFFRDPQTFAALKSIAFPAIMRNRLSKEPIRIWVPGCSTGEEVYSIAMCLLEFLVSIAMTNVQVQIFATDINEAAIEKARAGVYIENITADVSPKRLRCFFTKVDQGYQINKTIRDMCIFTKQDVTKNPPFSGLNLISCRNVLIYMEVALQRKVMSVFHYSLKPTGFLMLGGSETIGAFSDLFILVDKRYRIYSKKSASQGIWTSETQNH